jgi:hypothetical protein
MRRECARHAPEPQAEELSEFCIKNPVRSPLLWGTWDVLYASKPSAVGGPLKQGVGPLLFAGQVGPGMLLQLRMVLLGRQQHMQADGSTDAQSGRQAARLYASPAASMRAWSWCFLRGCCHLECMPVHGGALATHARRGAWRIGMGVQNARQVLEPPGSLVNEVTFKALGSCRVGAASSVRSTPSAATCLRCAHRGRGAPVLNEGVKWLRVTGSPRG